MPNRMLVDNLEHFARYHCLWRSLRSFCGSIGSVAFLRAPSEMMLFLFALSFQRCLLAVDWQRCVLLSRTLLMRTRCLDHASVHLQFAQHRFLDLSLAHGPLLVAGPGLEEQQTVLKIVRRHVGGAVGGRTGPKLFESLTPGGLIPEKRNDDARDTAVQRCGGGACTTVMNRAHHLGEEPLMRAGLQDEHRLRAMTLWQDPSPSG